MIDIIKFSGKNKRESVKKAMDFYYDNLQVENYTTEEFLSRCRIQADSTTIYYYPNMKVDINKYREFKAKRKRKK